jgi:hypothetical protein
MAIGELEVVTIAHNTFIVSALLLTATIVLLNYSWKKLKAMIDTMPADKRRVRFNLRSITDPNERSKYEFLGAQLIGCVFLALSLLGALVAVVGMSGVMVGDVTGPYFQEDFEFFIVAMRAGILCLFLAIISVGIVYVEELIALYKGEPSITLTNLRELPKRPPLEKAWLNASAFLIFAYTIVVALIVTLVPYNQWVQFIFAVVALIILTISVRFGYRACLRIRSKKTSTKRSIDNSSEP